MPDIDDILENCSTFPPPKNKRKMKKHIYAGIDFLWVVEHYVFYPIFWR
jgi:hypothetical protein